MAYDSARQLVTLFGGSSYYASKDTWEWDGAGWFQRQVAPGLANAVRGFAYDSARKKMLAVSYDCATAEWDGTQWASVGAAGCYYGAEAIAYDAARAKAVMFGGFRFTYNYDGYIHDGTTRAWNGTQWVDVSTTGPAGRRSAGLAYDEARKRVVLFGGIGCDPSGAACSQLQFPPQCCSKTYVTLNDTWEWDGSAWTQIFPAKSPPAQDPGPMVYDSKRGKVLFFSGGEVWEWDGNNWSKAPGAMPPVRTASSLAFDAARGVTVLYGGSSGPSGLGDTWTWDGTTWKRIFPSPMPVRYGHAVALAGATEELFVFGGYSNTIAVNDTWKWSFPYLTPVTAAASPGGRSWHAMASDTTRHRAVLFGGDGGAALKDTWELDGTNWLPQTPATVPPARVRHSMTFDSFRSRTIMVSGCADSGCNKALDDAWEWTGTNWESAASLGPTHARRGAALGYDPVRKRTVLFGGLECGVNQCYGVGVGAGVLAGDTWESDGSSWTKLGATGPAPRENAALTYDMWAKRLVLSGGDNEGAGFTDTWAWDGMTWTLLTNSAPVSRGPVMGFDTARQELVVATGAGPTGNWTAHRHGSACSVPADCQTGFCVDGICCETSSCGTCQACDTAANPGVCTNVPAKSTDADTCPAATNACDGAGKCQLKDGQGCGAAGECLSAACADGVCCNKLCNEACDVCSLAAGASSDGVCTNAPAGYPGVPSCGSYTCTGLNPKCTGSSCASDLYCASTHYCTVVGGGTCTPRKSQGAACTEASMADCQEADCRVCSSGNCSDGFCCNQQCTGACEACSKTTGALVNGTCALLPAGSVGVGCGAYLCDGTHAACPSGGCTNDTDCTKGNYCSGGSCLPQKKQGAACTLSSQCLALETNDDGYCVDGFCCLTSCTDKCKSCSAALKTSGPDGECGPVAVATDPHDDCAESDKSTCKQSGACDGNGACALWDQKTSCGITVCTQNSVTGQICDGLGVCGYTSSPIDCTPYLCLNDGCTSPCESTADCADKNYCVSGKCVKTHSPGKACTTGEECESSFCVDGVCCDSPCKGQCEACAATGNVGACVPVAGTPISPRKDCSGEGPCKGSCNGAYAQACTYPDDGTSCGDDASCTGDISHPASACDGTGTCSASGTKSCVPYACDAASGACNTTCNNQRDCAAGANCDAAKGKCVQIGDMCRDAFTVISPDGTLTSCKGFLCVAGACQQQCAKNTDCRDGYDCVDMQCVHAVVAGDGGAGPAATGDSGAPTGAAVEPEGAKESGGCGCRAAGGGGAPSERPLLAGLALLAMLGAGRRRALRRAHPSL